MQPDQGAAAPALSPSRAAAFRLSALGAVALGGFFGAAARDLIEQAVATPPDGFPWGTLAVNLSGALALGLLVELLVHVGHPGHGRLRLLVGTGFLGAFTTYSALAVETDLLVHGKRPGLAAAYLATSVIGGLAATVAGMRLGRAGRPDPVGRPSPVDPDVDPVGPEAP